MCQSITQHIYTIKIVYCQGDMFQPLLGHLQALWENRSKSPTEVHILKTKSKTKFLYNLLYTTGFNIPPSQIILTY